MYFINSYYVNVQIVTCKKINLNKLWEKAWHDFLFLTFVSNVMIIKNKNLKSKIIKNI